VASVNGDGREKAYGAPHSPLTFATESVIIVGEIAGNVGFHELSATSQRKTVQGKRVHFPNETGLGHFLGSMSWSRGRAALGRRIAGAGSAGGFLWRLRDCRSRRALNQTSRRKPSSASRVLLSAPLFQTIRAAWVAVPRTNVFSTEGAPFRATSDRG